MAYTVINSDTHLIDSAIGPLAVTTSTVEGFDIDDYVHSTVRDMAFRLQVQRIARQVNPQLAKNRMPVTLDDGTIVGGF